VISDSSFTASFYATRKGATFRWHLSESFRQSLRAIDVPSVPDPDDKDDKSFVDHLIDDSVDSNPQASEAGELSLQDATGVGLISETIDVLDEWDPVVFQFSGEPSLRFS